MNVYVFHSIPKLSRPWWPLHPLGGPSACLHIRKIVSDADERGVIWLKFNSVCRRLSTYKSDSIQAASDTNK